MSAPKKGMRDAREISYGFLAARASSALSKVLESQVLTADEITTLGKATTFLAEIADGALLTSKGEIAEGVRPSRSITALDFALGPLDSLRDLVQAEHKQIEPTFRRLSAALLSARDPQTSPELVASITEAQQFFEDLSGWLANGLVTRRRSASRARAHGH